jgi:ribosomal protein S18 acetylase RimI-like enzyme
METSITNDIAQADVREVRIIAGLTPNDVEVVLDMAATSGKFSSDALMSAEDMAWDTAYGDGGEGHTFLLATISEGKSTRIVGFICFGPIAQWPQDYEMYGIAVAPEFQRLGIGSALLSEMIHQIDLNDGVRIFLETGDDKAFAGARSFYEANEFNHETRFCKQFIANQGGMVYRMVLDNDESDRHFQ